MQIRELVFGASWGDSAGSCSSGIVVIKVQQIITQRDTDTS